MFLVLADALRAGHQTKSGADKKKKKKKKKEEEEEKETAGTVEDQRGGTNGGVGELCQHITNITN